MVRKEEKLSILFITVQLMLYLSFLILDFTDSVGVLSSRIKYIAIILCFCYALFPKNGVDKSILYIMRTALFFTLISDLFLLILDYHFFGVLTFIPVQILYQIRISYTIYEGYNDRLNRILRRILIILLFQGLMTLVICTLLTVFRVPLEALLIASILYFLCILVNTIDSVRLAVQRPRNSALVRFAAGMVLFLLCDINVGFFNLSTFIPLSQEVSQLVYSLSSIMMWGFYAPSQVMLTLSIKSIGFLYDRHK